jgi:hypothetical protein
MRAWIVALSLAFFSLPPFSSRSSAQNQPPPRGTLKVTVVDSTGAVLVGARVTATSAEPATGTGHARCR